MLNIAPVLTITAGSKTLWIFTCFRLGLTTIITALALQAFMDLIASSPVILISAPKTIPVKMEQPVSPTCPAIPVSVHPGLRGETVKMWRICAKITPARIRVSASPSSTTLNASVRTVSSEELAKTIMTTVRIIPVRMEESAKTESMTFNAHVARDSLVKIVLRKSTNVILIHVWTRASAS